MHASAAPLTDTFPAPNTVAGAPVNAVSKLSNPAGSSGPTVDTVISVNRSSASSASSAVLCGCNCCNHCSLTGRCCFCCCCWSISSAEPGVLCRHPRYCRRFCCHRICRRARIRCGGSSHLCCCRRCRCCCEKWCSLCSRSRNRGADHDAPSRAFTFRGLASAISRAISTTAAVTCESVTVAAASVPSTSFTFTAAAAASTTQP